MSDIIDASFIIAYVVCYSCVTSIRYVHYIHLYYRPKVKEKNLSYSFRWEDVEYIDLLQLSMFLSLASHLDPFHDAHAVSSSTAHDVLVMSAMEMSAGHLKQCQAHVYHVYGLPAGWWRILWLLSDIVLCFLFCFIGFAIAIWDTLEIIDGSYQH